MRPSGDSAQHTPLHPTLLLPFVMRIGLVVSEAAEQVLRRDLIHWPAERTPVVVFELVRVDPKALADGGDFDLLIAEGDASRTLTPVVELAARLGISAVLLTTPEASLRSLPVVDANAPEMHVVRCGSFSKYLPADVFRTLAEVVRRDVYRALLQYWRAVLATHELELEVIAAGLVAPTALGPRPSMAPLSVIEGRHIAGVMGFGGRPFTKANLDLKLRYDRLARLRKRPDATLDAATVVTPSRALTMMIVEDDQRLSDSLKRLFSDRFSRGGHDVELWMAKSAGEARERLRGKTPCDLMWVDVGLETPTAGLELVERVRREQQSTVIIGKSGNPTNDKLQRMLELGAFSVFSGSQAKNMVGLVLDGLGAAREVGEIVRLESVTARRVRDVESILGQAVRMAEAVRRVGGTREIIRTIETDLCGERPALTGTITLEMRALTLEVMRMAVAREGTYEKAARMLGIDRETLRRWLGPASTGHHH